MKTTTNPDQEKNTWVKNKAGEKVYPDILVVDTKAGVAKIIGEVETESTVDDESAEQWSTYSDLVDQFILYVPEGSEKEAKRLLQSNGISYTGLRAYSVTDTTIVFRKLE